MTEILIAIPTLTAEQRSEIIDICEQTGCQIKILPYLQNIITSESLLNSARNVEIEDLLCRESVDLDNTKIDEYIKGQTVLVTGGGGSIGSELCRQLVAFHPRKLIILDNYENTAYELYLELKRHFPEADIQVIIATVRDKIALQHIFSKVKPHVIFHAAPRCVRLSAV